MDPALAYQEIRIAAKWWRDPLVRRHDEALSVDLFASLPKHAPIRPERADTVQIALMAEIEGTFEMDIVLWDAAAPPSGSGLRELQVVGTRAPSEVVWAADFAGLAHVLCHLLDGATTAINPGNVVSYAGRSAWLKTTDVAALSQGGAS